MPYGGPPSKRGRLEVYSPYQPMQQHEVQMELRKLNPHLQENKIILLTILNAIYPINVELVQKICKPIADPVRIVVFQKVFLQVLVEFEDDETAKRVKDELHSCDIYPNSCTVKAEFAKAEKLNVKRNDNMTWDFTVDTKQPRGVEEDANSLRRKTLIQKLPGMDGPQLPQAAARSSLFENPMTGPVGVQSTGMGSSNGREVGVGGPSFGAMNQSYMQYMGMSGGGTSNNSNSYSNNYDWGGGYNGGTGSSSYSGGGSANAGFSSGSGSVIMVYGLDDRFNCMGVFNLFCLYGNVLKVSFMKNKPGCAIVEMSDPCSADRVLQNIRGAVIFGKRISIERSRKPFVENIRSPHELFDQSPSFVDFTGCNNHRFDTDEKAMKNRIVAPSSILHFYNVPKMTDDDLTALFAKVNSPCPQSIKWFDAKPNARTLTGLVKFDSPEDACEAIVLANHTPAVKSGQGSIHDMKLCFSKSRD